MAIETLAQKYLRAKAEFDKLKFEQLEEHLTNYRIKFEKELDAFLHNRTKPLPVLTLDFTWESGLWEYWKLDSAVRNQFSDWVYDNGFRLKECEEVSNGLYTVPAHIHLEII